MHIRKFASIISKCHCFALAYRNLIECDSQNYFFLLHKITLIEMIVVKIVISHIVKIDFWLNAEKSEEKNCTFEWTSDLVKLENENNWIKLFFYCEKMFRIHLKNWLRQIFFLHNCPLYIYIYIRRLSNYFLAINRHFVGLLFLWLIYVSCLLHLFFYLSTLKWVFRSKVKQFRCCDILK